MKQQKCYIIKKQDRYVFSYLLSEGEAVEIHCDDLNKKTILGSIYVGRVRDVVKNLNAVFVEIEAGRICHLPMKETEQAVYLKKGSSPMIQQGDELIVQVSREDIKMKYPSVTTNIILHGKYLLLTTGDKSISVSRKINRERKEELKKLIQQIEEADGLSYGILIRTNAASADDVLIRSDLERLKQRYLGLMNEAKYRTVFSCLMAGTTEYLSRLSDLYGDLVDQIITDDESVHREISDYLKENHPEDLVKLCFYRDRLLPMEKLYSLNTHLKKALSERVWLKSGAYLIIQPTEALTAIDVNTGKSVGGFFKVNMEAAAEIARQIRLRNLSGIIIVDFINMKSREQGKTLMNYMQICLNRDPVTASVVDITKLSLVEITRRKIEKPLYEQVCSCDIPDAENSNKNYV